MELDNIARGFYRGFLKGMIQCFYLGFNGALVWWLISNLDLQPLTIDVLYVLMILWFPSFD